MRIGITCYPTYGGSGIVATELGKELAARGHEIHFISYARPLRLQPDQKRIQFHEVEVTTYPLFDHAPYALALATKMVEVATSHELDLLHCHYAIPHSVSAFLARSMMKDRRLPVVTTLHGTDITLVGADRSYLPITRFSIEQSDGVTAISNYLKEATYKTFDVQCDIELVYNFVNCDVFRPQADTELRSTYAGRGEKILIHLSNFRPVKRPTDVVEIFSRVRREVPSVLLMVGDGPERSRSEWLVRDYGIADAVHFLGKRDNIEELIGGADVLLLPSENESFGLVALEAMACEVPVVASRVGGLSEVVTDQVDGFLIPAGAVDEMAHATITLLQDEARRTRMGKAARKNARSRFCSTKIIPQYVRLYQRVLDMPS